MPSETTSLKAAKAVKVLVADDDRVFRVLLERNVAKWGYECVVASDGEQAWRQISAPGGPCLAILDWVMPARDGLEVCRLIRAANLPRYVYVILLTARTGSFDLLQGLEAGVDDYVPKPVDLEQLRLRLKAGARILESESRQQSSRQQSELLLNQVRRVSARLFRTQDEERQTVARILHENVAQVLTSVVLDLSCMGAAESADSSKRDRLLALMARTAECMRELSSVSYILHPPLLDDIGLVPALRAYTDGITRQTGIVVELAIPDDFGRLDAGLELTLFRIAQEAITNVHRHSGASHATVRMGTTPLEVRMEIQDQGCGFPSGILEERSIRLPSGGVGILGMRERAEQRGGRLEIRSNTHGVTVTATLPIPSSPRACP